MSEKCLNTECPGEKIVSFQSNLNVFAVPGTLLERIIDCRLIWMHFSDFAPVLTNKMHPGLPAWLPTLPRFIVFAQLSSTALPFFSLI
jgi:hypothetical protein